MPIRTDVIKTELTALNTMCSYVGIPPLVDLADVPNEPDFLLARQILEEITTSVLSRSLPCNSDYDYEITNATVPAGALTCDPEDGDYTTRDGMIYDRTTRAVATSTSIKASIAWNMTFDSLPLLVQQYITVVAARSMVGRVKGDAALAQMTIPDEARVKMEFERYNTRLGDYSMLDNPQVAGINWRRRC